MGRTTKQSLAQALNADYRFRHGEMLRWMLSEALHLVGLKPWETVPREAMETVHNAIRVYEREVAESAPFSDVLGTVYMELVSQWGKSVLGQYFTPQPVARMMAEMTLGDGPPKLGPGELIRVCDPAAGSGVMMLSALQSVLQRHGPQSLRSYSVTGIDLDPVCARMFALQVVANCAVHQLEVGEVVAYHGNALGPLDDIKVILHATAPDVANVVPAAHPQRLEAVKDAVKQQATQLSLFEAVDADATA